MSYYVEKKIEQEISRLGADGFTLKQIRLEVISAYQVFEFYNDIVILSNEILDIPDTANLKLISSDNVLVTSKDAYENFNKNTRNEFFSNYLKITLSNYGTTFIPFILEFLKVIPVIN